MRSRLRRTRSRPLLLYIISLRPGAISWWRAMSYGWDRGRVKTTPGRPSIRYSDLRASAVVPEQSAPSSRLRWVTARPACRHSSSAVASPWCKTRAMPPLVGFQTGQCCRGHFRKPRVETLTEIHRQPYSITWPLRRALMSAWDQSRRSDGAPITVAVGTRVTSRPPAQIRTGPIRAYGLYGAFFVKGASRHFASSFAFHSLFDPRREHSSVPTAIFPSPSRAAAVKDGASSAPPKACP
jgi:hypothetical protein